MRDEPDGHRLTDRTNSRRSEFLRIAFVPTVAFVLIMAIAIFAFLTVVQLERRATEAAFQSAAGNRIAAIRREYETSKAVVDSVGSLFDASGNVSEEQLRTFVSPLLARYETVSAIGWAPHITHSRRTAHELEAQGFHPGYRITERRRQGDMIRRGEADDFFPVRFITPLLSNETALGFDLKSDPVRGTALVAATTTGEVSATGPIRLVQETRTSRSFLLFRALYRDDPTPDTRADGVQSLAGVVSAVVPADRLIDRALEPLDPTGIDFEIHDITDSAKPELLARHLSRTRSERDVYESPIHSTLSFDSELELVGRKLLIEFSSAPGHFEMSIRPGEWALLITGIFSAFAISAFWFTILRANARAGEYALRLQRLSGRLLDVQESERHHLARELHDQIGQDLTALKMNLHRADGALNHPGATNLLEESDEIMDRILDQVRTMSLELRPAMLDDLGLQPALGSYLTREAQRSGLKLNYECDSDLGRLPGAVETASFRLCQEAMTNVVRHARATTVDVSLTRLDGVFLLSVRDDGVGFAMDLHTNDADRILSFGLLGMQERVSLAGGKMHIKTRPGEGTEVEARFPI